MTGYGRAVLTQQQNRFIVEARSLNNRYCEVRVSGQRDEFSLEFEITKLVKSMFQRGKIDLMLRRETVSSKKSMDTKKLSNHYNELKKIQKSLGLKDAITFETVLKTAPADSSESQDLESMNQGFIKAATQALEALKKSRLTEGKVLVADIHKRIGLITKSFSQIEGSIAPIRKKRSEDFRERISKAIQDLPVDSKRVEAEIAMMIERSDVSEELVRFKNHLKSFEQILSASKGQSVGKELDFTIQELNREINTLGAKINDTNLSKIVVTIKAEIEKIREQVQNIE